MSSGLKDKLLNGSQPEDSQLASGFWKEVPNISIPAPKDRGTEGHRSRRVLKQVSQRVFRRSRICRHALGSSFPVIRKFIPAIRVLLVSIAGVVGFGEKMSFVFLGPFFPSVLSCFYLIAGIYLLGPSMVGPGVNFTNVDLRP